MAIPRFALDAALGVALASGAHAQTAALDTATESRIVALEPQVIIG